MLDESATLMERVSYSAYGMATHHWPGDWDGDGYVSADDEVWFVALGHDGTPIGDLDYDPDLDLNRDGVIDDDDLAVGQMHFGRGPLGGGRISDALGPENPIGYSGYVLNPETGLLLSRHRYYHPELGRWMSEDWVRYRDGRNMYQYVRGNPALFVDPTGFEAIEPLSEECKRKRLCEALARNGCNVPASCPSNLGSAVESHTPGDRHNLKDSVGPPATSLFAFAIEEGIKGTANLDEAAGYAAEAAELRQAADRFKVAAKIIGLIMAIEAGFDAWEKSGDRDSGAWYTDSWIREAANAGLGVISALHPSPFWGIAVSAAKGVVNHLADAWENSTRRKEHRQMEANRQASCDLLEQQYEHFSR